MLKTVLTVLLCAFPIIAHAAEIDFTAPLTDADDKAVTECSDDPAPKDMKDCVAHRQVTLGLVVLRALSLPEAGLAPDESMKRGQLGLSLYKATAAVLTPEDVVLIKKQVAKSFGPLTAIRVFRVIDSTVK